MKHTEFFLAVQFSLLELIYTKIGNFVDFLTLISPSIAGEMRYSSRSSYIIFGRDEKATFKLLH